MDSKNCLPLTNLEHGWESDDYAYLLDTNVFIQAKNLHYGFDFCPAFWTWLIEKNSEKKVFSIEKVRDEIVTGVPSNSQKKIKIPDVCIGLNIKFMSPYTMLRHEKALIVLE